MEYKSIHEIAKDFNEGVYRNKLEHPNITKLKDNHIFDENQSVKWNKEQVVSRNLEINELEKIYDEETNRLTEKLQGDVLYNLIYDYDLNEKQAEKIYYTAYIEKHSGGMTDVFYYATGLADFFQAMSELEEG